MTAALLDATGDPDEHADAFALCRDGELVHLAAVSRRHHLVLAA